MGTGGEEKGAEGADRGIGVEKGTGEKRWNRQSRDRVARNSEAVSEGVRRKSRK